MNIKKSINLMEKYAKCPNCGNGYIGNGQGGVIVEDNTFRRFCKCGFDVTVDESGNEVEVDSCQKCKYFLYSENNHNEYYCNYIDDYIFDLRVCKYYN